jgi:hypothetical protein
MNSLKIDLCQYANSIPTHDDARHYSTSTLPTKIPLSVCMRKK